VTACTAHLIHRLPIGLNCRFQKPNSWTYNFFEVSWEFSRLEVSVWISCVIFYQVFLLSPLQCTVTYWRNCKRFREFEEIKNSRQSCRGDYEYQGEKLLRLFSGFRPRIRPRVSAHSNRANVFCFLSSLLLLLPASSAGFGSYLSSLYSTLYRGCEDNLSK
jgi:hypothetical protein